MHLSPRKNASALAAMVAFGSALGPVYLFHGNRGSVAILNSILFSVLAALVAFFTVEMITRHRWAQRTPVLGARRGACAALVTYTVTLVVHACVHGDGPVWIFLALTLAYGIVLFGWVIAIMGAMVGVYCEKTFFNSAMRLRERSAKAPPRIQKSPDP